MTGHRVSEIVGIFLALAPLLGACNGPEPELSKIDAQQAGVAAPDVTLTTLSGETFRLSDYRGKVVVLNFWATWCPPCRLEIPHFVDLYEAYKDQGVVVVGVSLDRGGTAVVQAFARQHGITYPVAMASGEVVRAFSRLQGIPTTRSGGGRISVDDGNIQAIPTTFVIDQDGRIYRKHVGYRERKHLEPELTRLLEGGKAGAPASR